MMKALRYFLYSLAGLFLLVVIVALVLPFIVDPNDFRQPISDEVKKQTGRELVIGQISYSLFPSLGLSLQNLSLGNAAGFSASNMVELDTLDVYVEVKPLLRKQLRIDRIVIDGLVVNLEKNSKGIPNWDDLVPGQPAETGQGPAGKKPGSGTAGNDTLARMLAGLTLAGLTLNDSRINWNDRSSGQRFSLADIELEIGRYEPGKPFDVQSRLTYLASAPVEKARLAFSMTVDPDMENQRLTLSNLSSDNTITTTLVNSGELKTALTASRIVTDLDTQTLDARQLDIRANQLKITTEQLVVTGLLEKPVATTTLKVHRFRPRDLLAELGIALPVMADNENTLQKFSLQSHLVIDAEKLLATDIDLRLDETRLQGKTTMTDYSRPHIGFQLTMDNLDLDRYLPADSEKPLSENQRINRPRHSTASWLRPVALTGNHAATMIKARRTVRRVKNGTTQPFIPANFSLDGLLSVKKLKLANLRLQDIRAPIKGRHGRFVIEPLTARLYGGDIRTNVVFDASRNTPRTTLELTLSRIQANPLLKDFIDNDKLEGIANLSGRLEMQGLSTDQILRSLNGKLKLAFVDGAIRGINIPQMENRLRAQLSGKPLPAVDSEERTVFSSITGNLRIIDGQLHNNDLHAAMPHARAIGKGTVSLLNKKINYRLWIKFTSQVEGQKGTRYEDMDKAALPVYITGTFEQPVIKPDFDSLARQLAERELKKQEQKARQRVNKEIDKKRKELEQKARDALKNLFK